MNIFFSADQHFAHGNAPRHSNRLKPDGTPIVQPGDIGPDGKWVSPEIKLARTMEMDQILIDAHNAVVTGKDITYCIGDFAWRFHTRYITQLRGKLILILGSHDNMSKEVMKNFTEVHDQVLERSFDSGKFVTTLSHNPFRTWKGRVHDSVNLHGHVHARWLDCELTNQLDVGVDAAQIILGSMRPFALDEVRDIIKNGHPKVRFLSSIFEDPAAIEDEEDEARGSAAAMYAPKETT